MTQDELKMVLEFVESINLGSRSASVEQQRQVVAVIKESLREHAMREVQRLGQEIEQEPVTTLEDLEQEIYENTRQFVSHDVMEWMLKRYYTTPPRRTERPVDCERCNRLEEQAYDLVGKLRVANIKLSMQPQRTWVGLTDEQIEQLEQDTCAMEFPETVRAIEAAHGIKENT